MGGPLNGVPVPVPKELLKRALDTLEVLFDILEVLDLGVVPEVLVVDNC